MVRLVACTGLVFGVIALALPAAGRADKDKLSKVEIGKRGKAATAFVEVPKRGSGTAFCIHPSGLFVTNEHVVRGAENEEIVLVLNPSLDTQRVLKAKLVRADKEADLALLRVDGVKDLPSLPLGAVDGVAELADVVACGFPLGKALATDKKEYPAVSVNAGTVTALRQKGGQLQSIQVDVALTFGNSGGPVLDDTGKVIGVVAGGVPGTGVNRAIPVNLLDRFLTKPDLALTAPTINAGELDKPAEFKARVASFVPNAPEPSLKLVLQAGDQEPREFPMKKADGVWAVTAPPVAKTAARVEISVRIGTGMITGTTADAVLKIGDKPLRLSGVRRIEFTTKPVVLLADGKTTVEGEIVGLGATEIEVGGQKIKLDLSKATQITVQAAPEVVSVSATVVATVDGKEVARTETRITVRDANKLSPADPASVVITPPKLDEDKVVKRLPEVFTDVVVGGGGRYLIFHMPKLKKLAVFDVNEAKVTKYIPLTEPDITFAAGLDCIVIGLKKAGKLERWSLTTFELEKTATPPFKEDIKNVVMGHGSNGPVAVNGHFLDLATFQVLPITTPDGSWDPNLRPTASADGTVYGAWGSTINTFVLEGGVLKRHQEGGRSQIVPGPDGTTVYTSNGILSRTLRRGDPDDGTYGYCVPALRGNYFLSIKPSPTDGKGGEFTAYLRGLKQPIAKLDKANHGLHLDSGGGDSYALWSRVFFVPDAKVIAVIPLSNDQVVLYKFDPDAALEKSGMDYLIVTSKPPTEAKAGTTFTYPIKVKAKDKKVTYQLDSGPKGMAVSAAGVVSWDVPADATPGPHDVILTIRTESGQELFHTFAVKVVK